MAVLCEGISVIVRQDSIDRRLEGGWDAFQELVPNSTLCMDGELVRVGFMDPDGVAAFVNALESKGLIFWAREDDLSEGDEDIAVVDQLRGPTRPCSWLEYGRLVVDGDPEHKVSACWLFEGERIVPGLMHINHSAMNLHTPKGWAYERSLSHEFTFIEDSELDDRLELLRIEEGGLKVFRDRSTGKEVYLGTPTLTAQIKH